MTRKLSITIKTSLAIICLCMAIALIPKPVSALSGGEFSAGRIIDNFVFFRPQPSMTINEVQNFLNSKVPSCDTSGSQSYAGTTRAAYAASRGVSTPFTCLKDYRENTNGRAVEAGLCYGWGGGNMSAAEIIYYVSQSCGIDTKALIVLLQKEQGLVTDDWPWPVQYRSATGYGCPDTAACDSTYYGFFNQVYSAARQFKRYSRDASLFNYKSGINNYILYNPNAACGGSNVFIQNQATASLYNYTPYQPNASALANLNGTGDGCGAYGNRNFWRYYRDWFGPTFANDTYTAHPSGTLVSDGWRVFLVENNARRWIASPSIFTSYGYDWGKIKPASTGDNALPWTLAIDKLAPGTLFYSKNTPVYVMDYESGVLKKRHVPYSAFLALGYKWEELQYISPGEVPADTFSTPLTDTKHPAGTLVASQSEGKVYLIDQTTKRHVVSPLAFESNFYNWGKIKPATAQDSGLTTGEIVNIRQGTMLHANGIYLVDYDVSGIFKRPVGPWDCYADRLHYNFSDLTYITPYALPTRSGPTFTC